MLTRLRQGTTHRFFSFHAGSMMLTTDLATGWTGFLPCGSTYVHRATGWATEVTLKITVIY